MKFRTTSSLLLAFFLITACATYEPFTEPMLREFKLDTKNIKNVQFYLSAEIVMFKIEDGHALGKQGNVFVQNKGGLSQKVIIRRNAPCIIERIDKDGFFHLRFEEGANKTLRFRRDENNNRYYLYTEFINARHQLEYGNELYYVTNPSLISFIMVQVKSVKNSPTERVITGKKA
jgi:hypothetical protein